MPEPVDNALRRGTQLFPLVVPAMRLLESLSKVLEREPGEFETGIEQ